MLRSSRAVTQHVIIGRAPDCTLVLSHASVSSHHAKLTWRNGLIHVEDLASANGTWIAGKRVATATVRPGDEVVLGNVALPWSRPELRPFLRLGARGTAYAAPPPRGIERRWASPAAWEPGCWGPRGWESW
jgi:hypothetical protein